MTNHSLIQTLEASSPKGQFTYPENIGYAKGYRDAFDLVRTHIAQPPTDEEVANEIAHADTLFEALSDLLDLHEDEPERPAVAYALGVWNDHKLRRKELP